MARAFLSRTDAGEAIDPGDFGESVSGAVASLGVFVGARHPLHLRRHDLASGAAIAWKEGATGHLVFVAAGAVRAGDLVLDRGSVLVVEHRAAARVEAVEGGASLLVFERASDEPAEGAGGHVHAVPAHAVPRAASVVPDGRVGAALYADADCPTCRLWLHENSFCGGFVVGPHLHDEDEIIVVTGGAMRVGNRDHGVGAALLVAARTVYGFGAGDEGLTFINFRPGRAGYKLAGEDVYLDDGKFFRDRLGRPPAMELAADGRAQAA